jgi:PleD family two-component response regulator
VVTYPEGGGDAFELYRKADAMLYLSKDRGRNRCHFWREGDTPVALPAPPVVD